MNTPENKKSDRSRDEVLAGEYVLGLLPEDERRAVEQRIVNDRTFASMVGRWEHNLIGFNDEFGPDLAPPPKVFTQIENELFGAKVPVERVSLWRSLAFWQGTTLVSAAAAMLLLLAGPGAIWSTNDSGAVQLAELSSKSGDVGLVAYYDPAVGALQLTPAANAVKEKSLELWLIEGNQPPKSLGVIPLGGDGRITVPDSMRPKIAKGVTFAVSLEPFGGSKSGAPTGPVLMSGKVSSI